MDTHEKKHYWQTYPQTVRHDFFTWFGFNNEKLMKTKKCTKVSSVSHEQFQTLTDLFTLVSCMDPIPKVNITKLYDSDCHNAFNEYLINISTM